MSGNTRYRPACSLWPCGTCTRWTPSRGFTVSSSVPPPPRFSQRDNNVGPVKLFLNTLLSFYLKEVFSFVLCRFLFPPGIDDHGSFVSFDRLRSDPNISSIKTSTMITSSNSLFRERDAPSSARRSTSRHVRYRAVPRTNRTPATVNTHIHSATSSTSEPPACAPWLPSQCFCVDAS